MYDIIIIFLVGAIADFNFDRLSIIAMYYTINYYYFYHCHEHFQK